MTAAEFLSSLDGVRARGAGKWSARCPAHADRSPSLSVREGDRGILLKCFAGCATEEICAAIGINVADLFFDGPLPRGHRPAPRPPRIDRVALAFRYELHALDLRLRAERIIEAGKQMDVASLSDSDLDRALGFIAQAHADVERAELFEHVADTLRERDFSERKGHARQERVA